MAGEPDRQNKGKVELTFTTVLTFVFLVIAAMTAAYVWGVMSGRHLALESGAKQAEAPIPVQEPEIASKRDADILKPQELDFVNALRGDVRRPLPKAKEENKIETKAETKAPEPVAQTVTETAQAQPSAATPGIGSDGSYFDFVFQVAALKDEQAADNLREKLEGRGLRTRLERTGKLYLILVLLRGDESRAAEVQQIVRELRLGEPLLRSRKPV